ncbi:MAG: SEC-C domain-containing protein [Bryobacterales bacterium]|nr:SEC-C domain-containing protein [Bryobacterales bacterium]
MAEHWRRAIAETYYELGESDKAEALERGRGQEAVEYRRQAQQSAASVKTSVNVSPAGKLLRHKTKISFGGEGLPLGELPAVAAMLRGNSPAAPVKSQKISRNEPCPCGSGKKFKKCCGVWACGDTRRNPALYDISQSCDYETTIPLFCPADVPSGGATLRSCAQGRTRPRS